MGGAVAAAVGQRAATLLDGPRHRAPAEFRDADLELADYVLIAEAVLGVPTG